MRRHQQHGPPRGRAAGPARSAGTPAARSRCCPRSADWPGTITQSRSAPAIQPPDCGPPADRAGRDGAGDRVRGEARARPSPPAPRRQLAPRPHLDQQRHQDQAVEDVAGVGRAAQQAVEGDDHDQRRRAPRRRCCRRRRGSARRRSGSGTACRSPVGNTLICCAAKIDPASAAIIAPKRERHQLHPVDRDRHRSRRQRVLAHGAPGPAGARGVEQVQHRHRSAPAGPAAGRSSPCWW